MKAAFAISNEQMMTVAYGEGWTMKAAFSTWDDRIAPVFDVARHVLLISDGEDAVEEIVLPEGSSNRKVQALAERDVDVLICGAISRPVEGMVHAYNIRLLPFVSGQLDQVVEAWRKGELDEAAYAMPGCCGRRQRRRRGRCGQEMPPGHRKYERRNTLCQEETEQDQKEWEQ